MVAEAIQKLPDREQRRRVRVHEAVSRKNHVRCGRLRCVAEDIGEVGQVEDDAFEDRPSEFGGLRKPPHQRVVVRSFQCVAGCSVVQDEYGCQVSMR